MKRYGVTGGDGKIGSSLLRRADFVKLDCDVTQIRSIDSAVSLVKDLDLIINCAAMSSIDECEANEKQAFLVNVRGLANLHQVFGERVLNISSDHVFGGTSFFFPKEKAKRIPTNFYGWTKVGAEDFSSISGGKTIRLSRTVSLKDPDISLYLKSLEANKKIQVPTFFTRNYIHREFAADGIEFFVRNYDKLPNLINYASIDNYDMHYFMKKLADGLGFDTDLVEKRIEYYDIHAPRPMRGGLRVSYAKNLGFPIYNIFDTVAKLIEEYKNE